MCWPILCSDAYWQWLILSCSGVVYHIFLDVGDFPETFWWLNSQRLKSTWRHLAYIWILLRSILYRLVIVCKAIFVPRAREVTLKLHIASFLAESLVGCQYTRRENRDMGRITSISDHVKNELDTEMYQDWLENPWLTAELDVTIDIKWWQPRLKNRRIWMTIVDCDVQQKTS